MGRSYHVNCMGGAIDLPSQQSKKLLSGSCLFRVRIDAKASLLRKVTIALRF